MDTLPKYKQIQRDCEKLAKRVFILKHEISVGSIFKMLDGKVYRIAEDGSHRLIKKEK